MLLGSVIAIASEIGIGSVIDRAVKPFRCSIKHHPIIGTCEFVGTMFFSLMVSEKVGKYAKETVDKIKIDIIDYKNRDEKIEDDPEIAKEETFSYTETNKEE